MTIAYICSISYKFCIIKSYVANLYNMSYINKIYLRNNNIKIK